MKYYIRELEVARIIARQETGELSEEEQAYLNEWIEESPENAEMYRKLMQKETASDHEKIISRFNLSKFEENTMRRIRRRKRRIYTIRAASVAAVMVLGIFSFYVFNNSDGLGVYTDQKLIAGRTNAILSLPDGRQIDLIHEEANETEWRKYTEDIEETVSANNVNLRIGVPRGSEYRLRLDDGTVVWLNSESTLEYPKKFTGDKRKVKLSGEAYFEVERDEEKPFLVTIGDTEIRVFGTSFNITAYENEHTITTTLVSGEVEVATPGFFTRLVPGNQAIVQDGVPGIAVSDVDTSLCSSWTTGVLKFDKMTLQDVCARLSRWYDVDFTFQGGSGNERFTGGTWKYVPLGDFLSKIERVTDVKFRFDDNKVIVTPKR